MHGEIKLESELGHGTKTTFWIPFQKAHVEDGDLPLVDLGPDPMRPDRSGTVSPGSGLSSRRSVTRDLRTNPSIQATAHTERPSKNTAGLNLNIPPRKSSATATFPVDDVSSTNLDRKSIHVLVVEDK